MQPDGLNPGVVWRVARKEMTLFFSSPVAYLFIGAFALVSLFVFFWAEAFFARNIADVRPLFEWMPVLLIFLSAAITMRVWSDERRTGTLEHVLTQAVPLWQFVVGKFLGCWLLLLLAVLTTLPIPLTVSLLGDLDWGPVWAGYLATLLLGATYLSVGLFVSSRTDNPVVALMITTVIGALMYLLGSEEFTSLVNNQTADTLRALGTGSRFESITRGILDVRDLYYYLSLVAVFLALNTLMLEQQGWSKRNASKRHSNWIWVTGLLVANLLLANVWVSQIGWLRKDVTQGQIYSISEATQQYLNQLQEPLRLRGYFSAKTHPLLAPLVPQLRDLLKEYEIAGQGRVRVDIIDPLDDPGLEKEANEKYDIQPVPFQVADRYQSAIVSSYFNVVIEYGDQHKVLGFADFIEIKAANESDLDVQLKNPEYDLTRAIKQTLLAYQSSGRLFETIEGDVKVTGYVSDFRRLPDELKTFRSQLETVLGEYASDSEGRLAFQMIDPESEGGDIAGKIAEDYGFTPMAASLFGDDTFYFYLLMENQGKKVQVPLLGGTEASLKQDLESALKRFAPGFTKTIAVVTPPAPAMNRFQPNHQQDMGPTFNELRGYLAMDYQLEDEDLSDGEVSASADMLLLLAPSGLDETSLFAVDQFLMKGGTVLVSSSPFQSSVQRNGFSVVPHRSGLEDWFLQLGVKMQPTLVLDPVNSAFPVPVRRDVGGLQIQDVRMLDYPYFPDIRESGLNQDSLITASLPQLTMNWASPIDVSKLENNQTVAITPLVQSSEQSWTSDALDVMPKFSTSGVVPFSPQGETGSRTMGVMFQGRFDSWFKGKVSPLLAAPPSLVGETEEQSGDPIDDLIGLDSVEPESDSARLTSVIERSPESARLILFSSNDFLSDTILGLSASANRGNYQNSIQLIANAIDWSLEDANLLSIRSRSHFNRTLPPTSIEEQQFWEYANYVLACLLILFIAVLARVYRHRREVFYLSKLQPVEAD